MKERWTAFLSSEITVRASNLLKASQRKVKEIMTMPIIGYVTRLFTQMTCHCAVIGLPRTVRSELKIFQFSKGKTGKVPIRIDIPEKGREVRLIHVLYEWDHLKLYFLHCMLIKLPQNWIELWLEGYREECTWGILSGYSKVLYEQHTNGIQ